MDPLSIAASVAGLVSLAIEVTQLLHAYYKAVKSAHEDIKALLQEFDTLGVVTNQLKDFLESEKARGLSFEKTASVLGSAVHVCKAKIDDIASRLRVPKDKVIQRAIERLAWPIKKNDVQDTLETLRRYNHLFQFSLSIEGCALLSQTSEAVSEVLKLQRESSDKLREMTEMIPALSSFTMEHKRISEQNLDILRLMESFPVASISRSLRLLEGIVLDKQQTRIVKWLSPADIGARHVDVRANLARDTGRWLIEHQTFRAWTNGPYSKKILWCIGGPGVGKTTITSLVVDHLQSQTVQSDIGVAYFYCDYRDQHGSKLSNIIASLLRQFTTQVTEMPTRLTEIYEKHKIDGSMPTVSDMASILRELCSNFTKSFILVDAFDEIVAPMDRASILQLLNSLRSYNTRVYITSRAMNDLRDVDTAEIRIEAHTEDIRAFLRQTLREGCTVAEILDDTLHDEILDVISKSADGMLVLLLSLEINSVYHSKSGAYVYRFLIPVLQVRSILEQVTKSGIRKVLKTISSDLYNIYESSFHRIKAQSKARQDIATKSLMWIAYASRPLRVDELCHALAIQIGELEFDEDDVPSAKVIIESCSGLVTIDHESSSIRLVHYTLQDYIRERKLDTVIHEESTLTNSCLTYLLYDFTGHAMSNEDLDLLLAKYPFLAYASENWGHHAEKALYEEIQQLALQFLTDKLKLYRTEQVSDALSPWFDRKSSLLRGIAPPQRQQSLSDAYQAEEHGAHSSQDRPSLQSINSSTLNECVTATTQCDQVDGVLFESYYGLHSAARFGLGKLVALLISKGAHIESKDDWGNTALHEAAAYGRKDVANLLLDSGANPNTENHEYATPLFLASWVNDPELIQLLLRYGASIDTPCIDEWTALHKAADTGNLRSVKLLLQHGASVSCRTARGLTPLHRASGRGFTEIIKLLLEYGSEVDERSYDFWTPLLGACSSGQESEAKLLLEHGADVNAMCDDEQTPLHRASRVGHVGTVSLLLEHGADRKKKDSNGTIALHRAAKGGHDSTVELLMNKQSEQLFALNYSGKTAREEALYGGCYITARLLRRMEASCLGQSSEECSKLEIAIESEDAFSVKALLEQGVDIESPNVDGWRPLHHAVIIDCIPIASLLMLNGANVEASTTTLERRTALHCAARRGSAAGVKLCLVNGAAVNSRNAQGQTALHEACQSGNVETVVQLLEGKADVNADDNYQWRPIHKAASGGYKEILRVLLEHGAELDVRTSDKRSVQACAARRGHYTLVNFIRQMRIYYG